MRTQIAILRAARARLENKEDWGQGFNRLRAPDTCCTAEAFDSVVADHAERMAAYRAFFPAAGIELEGELTDWNDAPERTHADVLAAFDQAIRNVAAIDRMLTHAPADEPHLCAVLLTSVDSLAERPGCSPAMVPPAMAAGLPS